MSANGNREESMESGEERKRTGEERVPSTPERALMEKSQHAEATVGIWVEEGNTILWDPPA